MKSEEKALNEFEEVLGELVDSQGLGFEERSRILTDPLAISNQCRVCS